MVMVRNPQFNWKSMLASNFAVPSGISGNVTISGLSPGVYTAEYLPLNSSEPYHPPTSSPRRSDSDSITWPIGATHYGVMIFIQRASSA